MSAPSCKDCLHYRETMIFEECMRTEAHYLADGKEGQHTIGHMRLYECGTEARLFEPKSN